MAADGFVRFGDQADDKPALHYVAPTRSMKIGSVLTHVLSFTVFGLMFYTLKTYVSPDGTFGWASFALHPLLMTVAFAVLAPIGAVSWRTYEHMLGMSHSTTKLVHLVLMLAAAFIGAIGVYDMWLVHAGGAEAQIAKGWDVHFQSAHSWIGMMALVAFCLQALGGLLTFVSPSVSGGSRKAFLPLHIFVGSFALFGTLLSVITGVLSLGYRGDNVASKDVYLKLCASLTFLLCATVALVFASPKPQ